MINSEWSDYYTDPYNYTYQHETYNDSEISVSSASYYIVHCIFANFTSTSLYFDSTDSSTKLLIEDTSFFSCSTSGDGGCLYFFNSGQVAQSRIFDSNCYASDNGQHSQTYVSGAQNCVLDSTFDRCGSLYSNYNIFLMSGGNMTFRDLNITNCYCTGRVCYEFTDTSSDVYLNYSNIYNNSRNDVYSLTYHEAGEGFVVYITYMNIVENQGPNSEYGLMWAASDCYVDYNNYIHNNVPIYFYADSGSTMRVSNTYFDLNTTSGTVIFEGRESSVLSILSFQYSAIQTPGPKINTEDEKYVNNKENLIFLAYAISDDLF